VGDDARPGDLLRLETHLPEQGLEAGWYVLMRRNGDRAVLRARPGEDEEEETGVCYAGGFENRTVEVPAAVLQQMRRAAFESSGG